MTKMGFKRIWWTFLSIAHRLFDIFLHKAFQIAYFGKKEELPSINNLLLMSSATSLATKIRRKKVGVVLCLSKYLESSIFLLRHILFHTLL